MFVTQAFDKFLQSDDGVELFERTVLGAMFEVEGMGAGAACGRRRALPKH